METRPVSATGEGRHTTVCRELIRLDGGALVIDNPGMREFGTLGAESGIANSYTNISAFGSLCRYQDCSHTGEPGCAVLAAVQAGEISQETLDSYLKLKKETAFNDISYAEKRKKDRDFGRYLKSAKKDLRHRQHFCDSGPGPVREAVLSKVSTSHHESHAVWASLRFSQRRGQA